MAKQKQEEFISIPTLSELYSKDSSSLRKMIKKLGIQSLKVKRESDGRVVTVITDSDHQQLVNTYESLTANKAKRGYIPVIEAGRLLGYPDAQISNFTRACASYSIELPKMKFNGRTQSGISKSDFKKFEKIVNALSVKDV